MGEATSQSDLRLQISRTFAASRERTFRAWTEREALLEWHAPADVKVGLCEVDLRPGGRWRVHMQAPDGAEYRVSGVYRVIDPPERLVFTWRWDTDPENEETLVTVEFRDRAGETEVVLTHEGFPSEESRSRHEQGWTAQLPNLATYLTRA
jgi:uncharacterized protein YndB with AHSA1/START domain